MDEETRPPAPKAPRHAEERVARQAAALRSNLARRKARARAREGDDADGSGAIASRRPESTAPERD